MAAGNLKRAKMNIYHQNGIRSKDTVSKLMLVVKKIVEFNAKSLSEEHLKLGYTLENAHALGCRMYDIAIGKDKYTWMEPVKEALNLVANCYLAKGDFCAAPKPENLRTTSS